MLAKSYRMSCEVEEGGLSEFVGKLSHEMWMGMDRNTCVVFVCVVFCIFLYVLIQVGAFFCTYLVFLMDEVAQKQTLHFC